MWRTRAFFILFLAPVLLIGLAAPASAYLDPGSTSYLFQLAIGAILGLSLGIRAFWDRLRMMAARLFRRG